MTRYEANTARALEHEKEEAGLITQDEMSREIRFINHEEKKTRARWYEALAF